VPLISSNPCRAPWRAEGYQLARGVGVGVGVCGRGLHALGVEEALEAAGCWLRRGRLQHEVQLRVGAPGHEDLVVLPLGAYVKYVSL